MESSSSLPLLPSAVTAVYKVGLGRTVIVVPDFDQANATSIKVLLSLGGGGVVVVNLDNTIFSFSVLRPDRLSGFSSSLVRSTFSCLPDFPLVTFLHVYLNVAHVPAASFPSPVCFHISFIYV